MNDTLIIVKKMPLPVTLHIVVNTLDVKCDDFQSY